VGVYVPYPAIFIPPPIFAP